MPSIWYEVIGLTLFRCYYDSEPFSLSSYINRTKKTFDTLDELKEYIKDNKIEVSKWK